MAEDEAAVQAAVVDVSAVRGALARYFAYADDRRRQFCFMPQLDAAAPPLASFETILQAGANTRVSMGLSDHSAASPSHALSSQAHESN